MNYVVELTDSEGQACKIRLSLPLVKKRTTIKNSTWRVLDEGFLKFRSGGCTVYGKGIGSGHLQMVVGKYQYVLLNEFVDGLGLVNDSGYGNIIQEMCVSFKPGEISWVLIS